MDNIKSIVFCMENLEQFTVPIEYVETFSFRNIHHNLNYYDNEKMYDSICCDEAVILLKPEANEKAISSFDDYKDFTNVTQMSFFDRLLLYTDCVGIDIVYAPEVTKINDIEVASNPKPSMEIYVPWKDLDGNEYVNALMSVFKQRNKHLRGHGCLVVHFGKNWDLWENPIAKTNETIDKIIEENDED